MKKKLFFYIIVNFLFIIGCKSGENVLQKVHHSIADARNNSNIPINAWVNPTYGIEFVNIPAGCIEIGLSDAEVKDLSIDQVAFENLFKYQLPRHKVCVESFWMSKYEVTVRQFRTFVQEAKYISDAEKEGLSHSIYNGMKTVGGLSWHNPGFIQSDDHPVVNVSWNDARAMAGWLTKQQNESYRLPSEAEWEYACRAGKETIRFWGNQSEIACSYANIFDLDSSNKLNIFRNVPIHNCSDGFVSTSPVGAFKPNSFGLYDMIGNVAEWWKRMGSHLDL
jgi:formylglycine-generating enzyme